MHQRVAAIAQLDAATRRFGKIDGIVISVGERERRFQHEHVVVTPVNADLGAQPLAQQPLSSCVWSRAIEQVPVVRLCGQTPDPTIFNQAGERPARQQRISHRTLPLDAYGCGRMAESPGSASMVILGVLRQGCERDGRLSHGDCSYLGVCSSRRSVLRVRIAGANDVGTMWGVEIRPGLVVPPGRPPRAKGRSTPMPPDARDRCMLTSRLPIRHMASPPAHRSAIEPRRGTHHARTHLHVGR